MSAPRDPLPEDPPVRRAAFLDGLLLALWLLPATAGMVLYGSVRLWVTGPLVILTCGAGILLCMRTLLHRGPGRLIMPPGFVALVALGAYTLAVTPRAAVPFESALAFVRATSYATTYLGIFLVVRTGVRWRLPVGVLLVLGSAMAWYAIIQHVQDSNMVLLQNRAVQYGMRASGTFVCPNHFANVLQILLVFGLAVAVVRRSGGLLRGLALAVIGVSLPVLLLTESRSAWIGTAVGFAAFAVLAAWRTSGKRALTVALVAPFVIGAVGVGLWFGSPTFKDRMERALKGDVRIQMWQDTLPMIRDQPIWGHGPGSYRWVYPQYHHALMAGSVPRYAHNEYLNFAAEYGAGGLLIAVTAIAGFMFQWMARIRRVSSRGVSILTAGWLAALIGAAAHAFFDFNLHIFAIVHLLLALTAVVSAQWVEPGAWWSRQVGRGLLRCVALGAAAILAGVVFWTGRATASYLLTDASELLWRDPGRLKEAEWFADLAIQANAGYWRAHEARAEALRGQAHRLTDAAERKERAEQAVAAYRETLRLNPYRWTAVMSWSRVLRDYLYQSETALKMIQSLVRTAPRIATHHVELGIHLRRSGRLPEALEAFRKARGLDRRNQASAIRDEIRQTERQLRETAED